MRSEYWILIVVWIISLSLLFFIPRNKIRLALLAFLFSQLLNCNFGQIVIQLDLLAYPVRELADIFRTSFTYEFLAYPIITALFIVYYPEHRSRLVQFGYYLIFCTFLTIPEALLEKHTELIKYIHWSWFCTWSALFLTFLATRLFCVWFFKTVRSHV